MKQNGFKIAITQTTESETLTDCGLMSVLNRGSRAEGGGGGGAELRGVQ